MDQLIFKVLERLKSVSQRFKKKICISIYPGASTIFSVDTFLKVVSLTIRAKT
jgi:hypothetical protein